MGFAAAILLNGPSLSLAAQADSPDASPQRQPTESTLIDPLLDELTAVRTRPAERSAAAVALLANHNEERLDALADALDDGSPVEVRRAVLNAINTVAGPPPSGPLPDRLLAMRDTMPAELEGDWAAALGRYELERIAGALTDLAGDAQADLDTRRRAIRALGEHRQLFAAKALIELTSINRLEQVQGWAFDALAELSHQPSLGRDRAAWAQWYNQARELSASQWRQMLHDNLLRLTRERGVVDRQVRERLIQTQRALYRATGDDRRQALLIEMLQDPMDPVRSLAMELMRQRAEDNGEFAQPLRERLRAQLDDPLGKIREDAATLLGQLLDAPAADEMARRLGQPIEQSDAVQRAYLLALTQMPRVESLEAGYELLEHPSLQPQAAGMLAAALRAGLGDTPLRERLADRVREALQGVDAPRPQMVTLLGLVIAENDADSWSRIGTWLGAEDERVRAAAARVWAGSTRSLAVLAERSDDPVIRPIALRAIAERGSQAVTLAAVASRRPDEPDDLRLWEDALVALARQVPANALLETVALLDQANGQTRQVREHMLTASIDRPDRADPPTRDDLRLLIARAQARVLDDAPALVVLDYEAAIEHADQLNAEQLDRARRGLVRAYLADQRAESALATAADVLAPGGTLIDGADADELVTHLIDAAGRAADQGRQDDASTLVQQVRAMLGEALSDERDAQLRAVQARIDPDPPTDPAS